MDSILKYRLIFVIVPAILALLIFYLADWIPKTSTISRLITKALEYITESDLKELLYYNNFKEVTPVVFNLTRILLGIFSGFVVQIYVEGTTLKIVTVIAVTVAMYFVIYGYLKTLDAKRIALMNNLMPDMIEAIAFNIHMVPVPNAIQRAITTVPSVYRNDMETLWKDLNNPNYDGYEPFQNMIDRYHGRITDLDKYFRQLYRLAESGSEDKDELLTALNEMLSEGLNASRQQRADDVDARTNALGMVPVIIMAIGLFAVMLYYVMSLDFM